jgi:hypothetical protein
VTFKRWEWLKNTSEVTLLTKNTSFLNMLYLEQSLVECKVSLADGNFLATLLMHANHTFPKFHKHTNPSSTRTSSSKTKGRTNTKTFAHKWSQPVVQNRKKFST